MLSENKSGKNPIDIGIIHLMMGHAFVLLLELSAQTVFLAPAKGIHLKFKLK